MSLFPLISTHPSFPLTFLPPSLPHKRFEWMNKKKRLKWKRRRRKFKKKIKDGKWKFETEITGVKINIKKFVSRASFHHKAEIHKSRNQITTVNILI